ncbi:phospholipase-like protein [Tanacetum coccineum]
MSCILVSILGTSVQTPASPEWSSGSLPVSPASLTIPLPIASPVTTPAATIAVEEDEFLEVGAQLELYGSILHNHTQHLDALPSTLFKVYGRDFTWLFTSSEAVHDEIHSQRQTDAQRASLWQARYEDQMEIHALRMQHATDQLEIQGLRERVAILERRMDRVESHLLEQMRCLPDYVCKVIIRSKLNYFWFIKQKLDVKRRILFRSTCFGPWLDLMLFDHEPLLIDYMLRRQHKVDDQHHDMPLIYYMEGHKLHFGRREFSLITGFRFGTVSFDLHSSGELKFQNRVFPNKIGFSITNLDIIGVIEDEEIFGKLSDDDAIRLCLLLALEVIFMGRLLTFNVDDTLFSLVENIEAWNSFPWGEHLWCHLYDEIKNLKERHGDEHYYGLFKDRNYVPTYTLSSFVSAFQIWVKLNFRRGKVLDIDYENNDSKNGRKSVVLKHRQGEQEKKDAHGLLNNIIEETASKLAESRKSKVKALVGAFKNISPRRKTLFHVIKKMVVSFTINTGLSLCGSTYENMRT